MIGKTITLALLEEVGQVASQEADPPADVHGSSEYRKEMIKVYVRRAAVKALERAKEG
jgi:CO/xanthine dehydrogenase FAD-binding subunit